jgi:hypothetical protein
MQQAYMTSIEYRATQPLLKRKRKGKKACCVEDNENEACPLEIGTS